MEHYLDPGYLGNAGSSLVTGVSALRLANADIVPFHYSDYADAVAGYVRDLQAVQRDTPGAAQVDLAPLLDAAQAWGDASRTLEATADQLLGAGNLDTRRGARAARRINRALFRQERALTTRQGCPDGPGSGIRSTRLDSSPATPCSTCRGCATRSSRVTWRPRPSIGISCSTRCSARRGLRSRALPSAADRTQCRAAGALSRGPGRTGLR
jgi:hypothetical protein